MLDIKTVKSSLPSYNVKDFHMKQQEGTNSTKTAFFVFCLFFNLFTFTLLGYQRLERGGGYERDQQMKEL